MTIAAFIIAVAAVALFLLDAFSPKPKRQYIPLGLACFATAFIVQLVFNAGPFVTH